MSIGDDFSVSENGDIRFDGDKSKIYTISEFRNFLCDSASRADSSSDNALDIICDLPASTYSPNVVSLNGDFNIDEATATQLRDGSIIQSDGTVWSGHKDYGPHAPEKDSSRSGDTLRDQISRFYKDKFRRR